MQAKAGHKRALDEECAPAAAAPPAAEPAVLGWGPPPLEPPVSTPRAPPRRWRPPQDAAEICGGGHRLRAAQRAARSRSRVGRDAPKITVTDDGGARTWRLLHRGRVRRAWTTARHTPRRRRLLSWRNTLHSQAEIAIATVADDADAMSRVARGRKPFAQEWSGGAAADAALLGAARRLAARGGVGIMTARVELRCDGARERGDAGTTRTWRSASAFPPSNATTMRWCCQ